MTRQGFPVDLPERQAPRRHHLAPTNPLDTVAAQYVLDHTFDRGRETWTIRTLYLHLIEEWARHNGHADLIRQAIHGTTGE